MKKLTVNLGMNDTYQLSDTHNTHQESGLLPDILHGSENLFKYAYLVTRQPKTILWRAGYFPPAGKLFSK